MMTEHNETTKRDTGGVDKGLARHGHVSYLEIPAVDVEQSASFYEAVFGWDIWRRDDGNASFDDRSGDLIGRWVTCRAVSREPGLVPYIYVDRIDDVIERLVRHGGEVVKAPYPEGDLWVATFRDPAGNFIGVWQAGLR
jgi:predicted enzyme related to lactoylglutathione lyase